MPTLPNAYLTDARRIADTAELLSGATSSDPETVPAMLALTHEMRDFILRWQGQTEESAHDNLLPKFRVQLAGILRHIERLHLMSLAELLGTRRIHLLHEILLDVKVGLSKSLRNASEADRPAMEHIFRESHGPDFDPAADFQDLTEQADRYEAEWHRLVADYQISWPDRLEDPLYLGILSKQAKEFDALTGELELRQQQFDEGLK